MPVASTLLDWRLLAVASTVVHPAPPPLIVLLHSPSGPPAAGAAVGALPPTLVPRAAAAARPRPVLVGGTTRVEPDGRRVAERAPRRARRAHRGAPAGARGLCQGTLSFPGCFCARFSSDRMGTVRERRTRCGQAACLRGREGKSRPLPLFGLDRACLVLLYCLLPSGVPAGGRPQQPR